MHTARCARFQEDVVGLLEGSAAPELRDHVAGCDACRDASHELTTLASKIARAGDDFVVTKELANRLEDVAREVMPKERTSHARLRAADAAPTKRPRKKLVALVLAAACSVTASAAIGVVLADRQRSPEALASKPWRGKITKISRSGAEKSAEGIWVVGSSGKTALAEGAWVKAGTRIATDAKTRARIEFDDGSFLVLDRATEVSVENAPRTLSLADGAVLVDVAHVNGAPWAKILTPNGDVKILGTKLAVTATPERTNVEVLRGEVEIATGSDSHKVGAGQEGVVGKDGKVDVAPANDLAQRAAFGEQLIATHNEDTEAPASGLGELRAKKPGQQNEKDRAVHLAKHDVKIRIAGNVARTEIDETFANDTDEELEGIFRFPLPPSAQIERLALEVDGKLLDGEFLDKAKASAIWRGAIQNAAPQAPRPKEEIVWVPGPWHDPALLEWARGGRFELRIFPIPKRGARRVVIAYTETVAPVSGIRRYIYPLPQGSSSKITVDNFAIDAQVVGHESKTPVRVRGTSSIARAKARPSGSRRP
jgi:ferric-dicitrate binding protein FerR (iron transport regulator)